MRPALLLASLGAAGGIFLHTLFDEEGWGRRRALAQELQRIEAENQAAAARAEQLRLAIDALRHRTEVQVRVVQDELGYIHPGEVVVELAKRP